VSVGRPAEKEIAMRLIERLVEVLCRPVALSCWGHLVKSTLVGFLAGTTVLTAATWRVDQADVRVVCPMTIGGSFEAKTTALSGTVTAGAEGVRTLDGSLAVDLRTLDTGIGLRNTHLREKYLEVDRGQGFDTATLSRITLDGFNPTAPEGKGSFSGSLTVHGVTQTVTGPVDVRQTGAGLRVKATFPVLLTDYSIPKPRYLGIGVKDTVQVEVAFAVSR
jgi:polyisoprenoid-binding protein YceI